MKHPGANLDRSRAHVDTIPLCDLRALVERHHYSRGGSNTATYRHGLFLDGVLIGGAWWIPPTKAAAMANYSGDWRRVLSLSRLVCVPGAPRNSASFLLSKSTKAIQADGRYDMLLTYADEWQGHTGAIYRACGWTYAGKTNPEATFVNAHGVMMGRKRGPKTYTRAEMQQMGFALVGRFSRHRYTKNLREKTRQGAT
jgi:hypothetical protein